MTDYEGSGEVIFAVESNEVVLDFEIALDSPISEIIGTEDAARVVSIELHDGEVVAAIDCDCTLAYSDISGKEVTKSHTASVECRIEVPGALASHSIAGHFLDFIEEINDVKDEGHIWHHGLHLRIAVGVAREQPYI